MSEHRPERTPDVPDPAFDRLRAADPAAHLEAEPRSLHAAARRRAEDGGPAEPDGRDELAAARAARRPSRWAAVAAVAAGTLVVGSAGYALGERAGADDPAPTAVAVAETADATSADTGLQAGGRAGAEASVAPEAASSDMLPWIGGRTVFRAEGLSGEADVAEAWAYDPGQVFGQGTAAEVASSLGLDGEPRLEGVTWVVGPFDGSGPNLQLQPDGVASVSYFDPTLDPFACAVPQAADAPEGSTEDGASSAPAPIGPAVDCDAVDAAVALEGDAAVAQAREVLAGAGTDPAAFEYEVIDAEVPSATYVTAFGTVGGQRTGNVWSMTLVGEAVQSLYGALAPLVPLGTYDVVSPAEAVARLTDPRFGAASGGPVLAAAVTLEPMIEPDTAVSGGEPPASGGEPPAAVEPGSTFAWPVTEVVLTDARLGLAQHTQPDGSTVLLPAYRLSTDDGAAWTVVAVAESGLDFDDEG